jgi:hypothetical protein
VLIQRNYFELYTSGSLASGAAPFQHKEILEPPTDAWLGTTAMFQIEVWRGRSLLAQGPWG